MADCRGDKFGEGRPRQRIGIGDALQGDTGAEREHEDGNDPGRERQLGGSLGKPRPGQRRGKLVVRWKHVTLAGLTFPQPETITAQLSALAS